MWLLCAVALAALANGCAPAESQLSIVIVVIDTLRPDHLGLYGYEERPTSPNLDERAASAAVFEYAYTTSPWTLPAFGPLFTGQLPTRHSAGVIISSLSEARETGTIGDLVGKSGTSFLQIRASLPTLAGVLEDAGYHTGTIVNNAFLSPEFGLDRGFQTYDYYAPEPDRRATEVTDLALAWLDAHDASRDGTPFLLVVHYFDPHMPYEAPAPFLGRFAAQYADDQYGVPLRGFTRCVISFAIASPGGSATWRSRRLSTTRRSLTRIGSSSGCSRRSTSAVFPTTDTYS